MSDNLGYEQLSDFIKYLLREPWANKRFMEQLVKTMDAEYDTQLRQKPGKKIKNE